mgnify:CR=1 FL=1
MLLQKKKKSKAISKAKALKLGKQILKTIENENLIVKQLKKNQDAKSSELFEEIRKKFTLRKNLLEKK